ncbi:hypothetical protein C4D60_Mb01t22120 [Musa balbisiana]|uniref:Uncharacterized protein n=1 Tax=Musa balbisiana TaxID=52838 RepID=A0A4S8JP42_MUSBA|nr:hypothetical protein C4D60_Mb01t22120 [Musa balbisiana]
MSGGGSRVSIPADTFHEVRRKRDKRKENVRDPNDARWRPGVQGRGGRGGRGKLNYSSHSLPSDDVAGRNVTSGKENGLNQGTDKANTSFSSTTTTLDTDNNSAKFTSSFQCFIASYVVLTSKQHDLPDGLCELSLFIDLAIIIASDVANGPSKTDHPLSSQGSHVSGASGIAPWEENSGAVTTKSETSGINSSDVIYGSASGQSVLGSDHSAENRTAAPVFEVSTSISDLKLCYKQQTALYLQQSSSPKWFTERLIPIMVLPIGEEATDKRHLCLIKSGNQNQYK